MMQSQKNLQIKSLLEELLEEGETFLPFKVDINSLFKVKKKTNFYFNSQKSLDTLSKSISNCNKCQLHQHRTNIVFGEGNSDAELVFVGEAPGYEEDKTGNPFVGKAGKLLEKIISNGFKRDRKDFYICNVLKCRPPGNRDPEKEEIKSCISILKEQLRIISPKVICTLGRIAASSLLGKGTTLSTYRGKIHYFGDIPVIVTYHPSALLRNTAYKKPTWNDMKIIIKILEGIQPKEIGLWI